MSNNLERPTPSRRGGGGREEGWGRLRRPASCSPAASHLPPMGDASVPTPLLTSPAPTNVTICPKIPTVERPLRRPASCSPAASHLPPMGDASVPTPLLTSPAPTNVTICLKIPTVERLCGCRRPHYSVTPDGSYSYVILLKDKDGGAS